jgi:hypothetical protein
LASQTRFRRELHAQAAHLRRVILREEFFEPFVAQAGGAYLGANPGSGTQDAADPT